MLGLIICIKSFEVIHRNFKLIRIQKPVNFERHLPIGLSIMDLLSS